MTSTSSGRRRVAIEWSDAHRICTATAFDLAGQPMLVVSYRANEPVGDCMARLRMEAAAEDAVRSMLATEGAG
jgi:hypothetical protein